MEDISLLLTSVYTLRNVLRRVPETQIVKSAMELPIPHLPVTEDKKGRPLQNFLARFRNRPSNFLPKD